jgi:hypothetical protein
LTLSDMLAATAVELFDALFPGDERERLGHFIEAAGACPATGEHGVQPHRSRELGLRRQRVSSLPGDLPVADYDLIK